MGGFTPSCSCLSEPGHDVGVGVEGDGDAGVPEALRDDLGVDAGAEGEGGRGVPQVVQADRRQPEATDQVPERLRDVLRLERSTIGLDEEQIVLESPESEPLPVLAVPQRAMTEPVTPSMLTVRRERFVFGSEKWTS